MEYVDGNDDYKFLVSPALNGAPAAYSLHAVAYPTYYLSLVNKTSGLLGIAPVSDSNDASWAFDTGLAPAPPGTAVFSLRSLSTDARWQGK